ncbi:MAG: tetratricopeptide repeat protein [Gallionella sp.]|nr:tetratricopeptide repeat protein [Gallionella sp.]
MRFSFRLGLVSALALSPYLAPLPSAYAGEEMLALPEPYVVASNDFMGQFLGVFKETEQKEEKILTGKAYRLADQAYKALAEGKVGEAEGFVNEALLLRPDSKQLGLISLDIQMRKGDLIKARLYADNLLARYPNDSLVLASRGYICQRQNRHDLAAQDFAAALRQPGLDDTQQRNVRLSLADSAIAIKRPQQALDALIPLVTPESYAVQIRITQARLMMGERNAARAAGEKANELAANDAERKSVQQLLLNTGVPVAKPSPPAVPTPPPGAEPKNIAQSPAVKSAVDEGYKFLKQRKDRQALKAFQRAFAAGQGSATAYADAGYTARRLGEHDVAADLLNKALTQSPGLDAAHERDARLNLADGALAKQQPQQALDVLATMLTEDSYAVQIRLGQAYMMLAQRDAARAAVEWADKRAATDDQKAFAQSLLKNINTSAGMVHVDGGYADILNEGYRQLGEQKDKEALAAFQRAFAAGQGSATAYADAGYTARRLGEHDVAADLLNKALTQSPGLDAAHERDARLNLADGALAKQQPQQALDVLATMLTEDSYAVQIRLGQAYMMLAQRDAARAAVEWADKRAATDDQKAFARSLLKNLNTSVNMVHADGGYADLNEGYRQLGEHKDKEALAAFQRAFANGYGSATNYADAGYAAKRLGENSIAAELIGHALELNEKSPESAKPFNDDQAIGYRSEMLEMSRKWGLTASLVRQRTLLAGRQRTNTIQGGLEGYWQPYNDNNRFVQLYARTYQTFHEGINVGTNGSGTATNQGAAGVRVKPFTDWGFTVGLERLIHFGMFSRMDWLVRMGYSTDSGYELKPGKASLADWNFYGEAGYYFEPGSGLNAGGGGAGNAYYYHAMEATYGKSVHLPSVDAHLTAYPHLVATNETDNSRSARARPSSSTIGPGVKLRYWFSEKKYQVPSSVIDLDIQYRFKVDNSPRGSGLLVRGNYWF